MKKLRRWYDGRGAEMSEATALLTLDEHLGRQEFAEECDLNVMLNRYGIPVPGLPLTYGEVDYDQTTSDLQLAAYQTAEAFRGPALRPFLQAYGGIAGILRALEAGELEVADGQLRAVEPAQPPAGATNGGEGTPPSPPASEAGP